MFNNMIQCIKFKEELYMKIFLNLIFIGLSSIFILSGCGGGNTTNSSIDDSTNTLTVKSVELK